MTKAFYRNTGTNQMVFVPVGFFDPGDPLWELVDGGGAGGEVTQAELDALEADTTGPHGVDDFSALETQDGATHKVADGILDHSGASDPHGDRADTTAKIGIHSAAVDPHADRAFATSEVSTHNADTTGVHGRSDMLQLETLTGAQGKVDTHAADTTAVHGITDTALLALKGDLVFNVRDYGAVGNGVADDTAAITAAVAAIPAGGGVLFFPATATFYAVSAGHSFVDRKNITIRGAAAGATIRYIDGTTDVRYNAWPTYGQDSIFRFVRCDDILIEGLTLNGNITNRTANLPFESFNSNLTFAACNRVTVRQCHITEGMTDGITVMYSQAGTLSTRIVISDCVVTKCRRNNISLVGQDGVVITDCLLDEAGVEQGIAPMWGLDIEPDGAAGRSKNIFVQRNTISNSAGTYGMSVGGTGTVGLVVSDNIFLNNANGGLDVETSSSQVTVTGNQITGSVNGAAIRAIGDGADLIENNLIQGNKYGIITNGADKVTMSGNKILNNSHQGIVLTDFIQVQVIGNTLVDNTSAQGEADSGGYALYATRTDVDSVLGFHDNVMLSTPGAAFLMSGARVDAACNARANNNVGRNLRNNNAMIYFMTGHGNWSVDGADRFRSICGEANFDDIATTTGGRLLIGGKVHYFGTAAPTTGTWQRGDVAYSTSPGISKPLGWVCLTNGTPGTWLPYGTLANMSTDKGDADATLTVGVDSLTQQWKTALTADRTITLATAGAYDGVTFRINRSGGDTGGPWALSVGGLASLHAAQWADVQYDGASWRLVARGALTPTSPDIQFFTSSGTWNKPTGAKTLFVSAAGGGSGGGSGRRGAAASIRCGGGGGAGAAWSFATLDANDVTSTVAVTVGAGGAGGAAVTANDTNGNPGTAGSGTTGLTSFGSYLAARGGGTAGAGGTAATGLAGGSGVGIASGSSGGFASTTGGVGTGGGANTAAGGAGGGGAGGGITSGDVAAAGGAGSQCYSSSQTAGGTAGAVDSTAPTGGTASTVRGVPGPGGGGGAASITTAAQAGATAANYGGGGGGGGASLNGNNSGAGGAGAPGFVMVTTRF